MKLTKLLIIALLLLSSFAEAQQAFKGSVAFGMTTSQMSGDGLGGWHKFGLTGGGYITAPLSNSKSIRFGIQYAAKGSRTKLDTLTYNSFAYRLNYIEVPVQVGFQNGPFTFYGGLYYGQLINQEILANKVPYSVIPAFKKYDVGLAVNVSVPINDHLFLEGKFSTSVVPIRPSPNYANPLSYYERGNYNQVLYFTLGRNF